MPDQRTPDDPGDGHVDYSNRDYHAPTGYQAPDFLSKWAAPSSTRDDEPTGTDDAVDDPTTHAAARPAGSEPAADSWTTAALATSAQSSDVTTRTPSADPGTGVDDDAARADDGSGSGAGSGWISFDDAPTTAIGDESAGSGSPAHDGTVEEDAFDENALADDAVGDRRFDAGAEHDVDGQDTADGWARDASASDHWASSPVPAPAETPQERFAKRLERDAQRTRAAAAKARGETGARPAGMDPSGLAVFLAIGAMLFVLAPAWLTIVFAVAALVAATRGLRRGDAARIRSMIAMVVAVVAIVVLLVVTVVRLVPDEGGADTDAPNGVTAPAGALTYSGSGDGVIDLELPDPSAPMVADVTLEGESLDLYELRDGGADRDNLAWIYSPGTESVVVNGVPDDPVEELEIEADGAWTVSLRPITELRSFDGSISGTGEEIVVYTGPAGAATFTLDPDDYVDVEVSGSTAVSDFSESGTYRVTRPWAAGPIVIHVEASSAWSIEVGPDTFATPDGSAPPSPADDPGATDATDAPAEPSDDVPADDGTGADDGTAVEP